MGQAELPQAITDPAAESVGAAWFGAMEAGDFPRAWQVSDRVLALRLPAERDDPGQPFHLRWVWDGTALDGRDVLVRCYHGLGDTLQFSRYLPALRRRAARVTLEVQASLVPLMARIGGADRIVPFDPAAPLPPGECDVEIMELSHALRIAPVPVPYLPLDRVRLPGARRVGFCWQAQKEWRPERSIPTDTLDTLLAAPGALAGIDLQSLQPEMALGRMAPCPAALGDTAARIATLDLVLTVDTMVAHLAGAIGVPVWLLLDTAPDWRWGAGGRGSPWYRGVRKYHQRVPGDWAPPLRAALTDLTWCGPAGTVDV